MNKKGVGYLIYVLFLAMVIVAYAISLNPDVDIEKIKSNITWKNIDVNVTESPELGEALESLVNGLGAASFSFIKFSMDFTKEYPDVPWKLILIFVIFAIVAPILMFLVKFILIAIIFLRDYFQNRKEKKEIRGLRENKEEKKDA